MGRNRVVAQGTEHIEISDGDWIEVKRELNTGDQKRLDGAGLKPPVLVGNRIINPVDWGLFEMEKALIWLTDWSIVGPDGKVLPLNMDAIKSIDTETFEEINDIITVHKKKQDDLKKSQRESRTESQKSSLKPAEVNGDQTSS